MASQVEIFNIALANLGQRPVSLPSENTPAALSLSRAWDSSRKECLSGNNWPFATVIELLSVVSNYTPPAGWLYAYQYPSKCVRMWKIYNQISVNFVPFDATGQLINLGQNQIRYDKKHTGEDFREIFVPTLNSPVILSNCPNAYGEYSYDVTDPSIFDATFVTMLGFRLAADTAMSITGDPSVAVNMIKIFNSKMSEAQRISSYENNTDQKGDTSLVDSRG